MSVYIHIHLSVCVCVCVCVCLRAEVMSCCPLKWVQAHSEPPRGPLPSQPDDTNKPQSGLQVWGNEARLAACSRCYHERLNQTAWPRLRGARLGHQLPAEQPFQPTAAAAFGGAIGGNVIPIFYGAKKHGGNLYSLQARLSLCVAGATVPLPSHPRHPGSLSLLFIFYLYYVSQPLPLLYEVKSPPRRATTVAVTAVAGRPF